MNKRDFRREKIEIDKQLISIREKEFLDFRKKIEFDMLTKQSDSIKKIVEITLKLVKLEIKELLEEKTKE